MDLRICRACLKPSNSYKNLCLINYDRFIEDFCNIKLYEERNITTDICIVCLRKLMQAQQFKQQVESKHENIRESLELIMVMEDDDDDDDSDLEICRTCLNYISNCLPLFGTNRFDILQSICNVEIKEEADLPKFICEFCTVYLIQANDFKKQVKLCDERIRATLQIDVDEGEDEEQYFEEEIFDPDEENCVTELPKYIDTLDNDIVNESFHIDESIEEMKEITETANEDKHIDNGYNESIEEIKDIPEVADEHIDNGYNESIEEIEEITETVNELIDNGYHHDDSYEEMEEIVESNGYTMDIVTHEDTVNGSYNQDDVIEASDVKINTNEAIVDDYQYDSDDHYSFNEDFFEDDADAMDIKMDIANEAEISKTSIQMDIAEENILNGYHDNENSINEESSNRDVKFSITTPANDYDDDDENENSFEEINSDVNRMLMDFLVDDDDVDDENNAEVITIEDEPSEPDTPDVINIASEVVNGLNDANSSSSSTMTAASEVEIIDVQPAVESNKPPDSVTILYCGQLLSAIGKTQKLLCPYCNGRIAIRSLNEHLWLVGRPKLYPCYHCDLAFYSNNSLSEHKSSEHGFGKGYNIICNICHELFRSLDILKRHKNRHHVKDNESYLDIIWDPTICVKDPTRENYNAYDETATTEAYISNKPDAMKFKVIKLLPKVSQMVKVLKAPVSKAIKMGNVTKVATVPKVVKFTKQDALKSCLVFAEKQLNLTSAKEPNKIIQQKKTAKPCLVYADKQIRLANSKEMEKMQEAPKIIRPLVIAYSTKEDTGSANFQKLYCPHCFTRLPVQSLNKHLWCMGHSKLFPCWNCNLAFHSHNSLLKHQLAEHSSGEHYTISCEICSERFRTENGLKRHHNRHHIDRKDDLLQDLHINNKKCKTNHRRKGAVGFDNKEDYLLAHDLYFLNEENQALAILANQKNDPITLTYYQKFTKNGYGHQLVLCPYCHQILLLHKLEVHLRTTLHKELHLCKLCDLAFHTPLSLWAHSFLEHSLIRDYPIKCIECNLKFSNKNILQRHNNRIHSTLVTDKYKYIVTREGSNKCKKLGFEAITDSNVTNGIPKVSNNIVNSMVKGNYNVGGNIAKSKFTSRNKHLKTCLEKAPGNNIPKEHSSDSNINMSDDNFTVTMNNIIEERFRVAKSNMTKDDYRASTNHLPKDNSGITTTNINSEDNFGDISNISKHNSGSNMTNNSIASTNNLPKNNSGSNITEDNFEITRNNIIGEDNCRVTRSNISKYNSSASTNNLLKDNSTATRSNMTDDSFRVSLTNVFSKDHFRVASSNISENRNILPKDNSTVSKTNVSNDNNEIAKKNHHACLAEHDYTGYQFIKTYHYVDNNTSKSNENDCTPKKVVKLDIIDNIVINNHLITNGVVSSVRKKNVELDIIDNIVFNNYRVTKGVASPVQKEDPSVTLKYFNESTVIGNSKSKFVLGLVECPQCHSVLYVNKLGKHLTEEHKCGKVFACYGCDLAFYSEKARNRHYTMEHSLVGMFRFSCNQCNAKLRTEEYLKRHMNKKHSPNTTIACIFCGAKGLDTNWLRNHHSVHFVFENNEYKCLFCDKKYNNCENIAQHEPLHASWWKSKCTECSMVCRNTKDLSIHNRLTHRIAAAPEREETKRLPVVRNADDFESFFLRINGGK